MGIADHVKGNFPYLELHLKQAEVGIDTREAIARALRRSSINALIVGAVLFGAFIYLEYQPFQAFLTGLMASIGLFGMIIFQDLMKYKIRIKRRVNDIDRNLLYALQSMEIEASSGLPIFESVKSVANGKYGALSSEFKLIVNNVESGSSLENELEATALRNPSTNFRQALWQISNSIRSGADLKVELKSIVTTISKEELVQIRRYGSKLSPIVLMFLMLAIIIPSMGVTVLIIVSSLPANIVSESTLWTILISTAIVQVLFINLIKGRRPNVSVT